MTPEEKLQNHLTNRDALLAAIAREVYGPGSVFDSSETLFAEPTAYDLTKPIVFEKWEDYSKVRPVVSGTGEEILRDERPSSRFGMGILFPELDEAAREIIEEQLTAEEVARTEDVSEVASDDEELEARLRFDKEQEARQRKIELKAERSSKSIDSGPIGEEESDSSSETSDMQLANLRRQRSLGISFVVDAASPGELKIQISGGRYKRFKDVRILEKDSAREITWWARRTIDLTVPIPFKNFLENGSLPIIEKLKIPSEPGIPDLKLQLEIRVRGRERIPGDDHPLSARLLTVTLVNRGKCNKRDAVDEHCLFQAHLSAKASEGDSSILSYPRHRVVNQGDEQQSLDLLYRHEQTFATGHGCSGAWQANEAACYAKSVSAEVLPYYESPAITPNLVFVDSKSGEKKELTIPLSLLSDDERVMEALSQLKLMVDLYENWIEERKNELPQLESTYNAAAQRHIASCQDALKRMRKGIQLLTADPSSDVSVAFRLTNQAMLIQALASGTETRVRSFDENTQRAAFSPDYHEPDISSEKASIRAWRPFQIAFLLMNLPSLADPNDPGREIVDLIWFPTGGGKTEAYLGCAAFSILMRRIRDPKDIGTHVLMRYTLRLLTAQQFQRASSLICAMECLRSSRKALLGEDPFTIGIWVGGDTTPNSRTSALKALSSTTRNGEEDYKMVLLKCPWCGAEMGPKRKPGQQKSYEVHGVRKVGQDVRLHCPDKECRFSIGLPVKVIDEDLYEEPPTYVIATVDKFASLAWRAECRSLFGIGENGQRVASPPGLIIQDELHLITGPLGSMVGLYETLIDELATDHRGDGAPIKPKLIAATATTRASDRQIRDLYARDHTCIFPAPGLDAADSFFARYERNEHGNRKPGRRYVGLLPLNYSSALTASVRIYGAAMSAAYGFSTEEERDPWWTLLVFYNSLRELGANLTLFGADIPERMKDIQRRWYPGSHMRFVNQVLELTGRLANSEVPRALEALGRIYKDKPAKGRWPVDACLASNIIEVGVDVDRLGLMAVAGQPKTTAQYIQATGRVGRKLPGLILVNYGATKARDRSHYEHFQSYHSRLYAQVEPASVTPFTIPVLERALHAVIVAHARQTLPVSQVGRSSSPSPFAGTSLEKAAEVGLKLLERRIVILANGDKEAEARMILDLKECHMRRIREWQQFQPVKWLDYFPKKDSGDQPLLRPYGSPCPSTWEGLTWETPNSLRGVDAECKPSIPHYLVVDED